MATIAGLFVVAIAGLFHPNTPAAAVAKFVFALR
jgi:hypothetical protein